MTRACIHRSCYRSVVRRGALLTLTIAAVGSLAFAQEPQKEEENKATGITPPASAAAPPQTPPAAEGNAAQNKRERLRSTLPP